MAHELFSTLRKDHEEVKNLLKKIKEADGGGERKKLLKEIRSEILPHMSWEECFIYEDMMNKDGESRLLGMEGVEEHLGARHLLDKMTHMDQADDWFKARAHVLFDMVQHHVKEEEEEVFPILSFPGTFTRSSIS